jgi:hypothetical protein
MVLQTLTPKETIPHVNGNINRDVKIADIKRYQ